MKILFKILYLFSGTMALIAAIASCNKPDEVISPTEGNIYMPTAARTDAVALLLTDTAQTIPFGAAYGGLAYPGKDITVGFNIDAALVSSYNAAHGTNYIIMPSSSYTVPSLSAVIKSGQTSSDALPIKVITANLNRSAKYIIPVSITSVSAGHIDSVLNTTYFRIDAIQRLEKDVTSQATLTVSKDNGGGSGAGEGSPKLVDEDYNTKFLTDGFPQTFWVNLAFPSSQIIGAYTITSGNDVPERDMKDWELVASNDGTTWTTLDTQAGRTFSNRNMTVRYELTNTTAYKQYRINVKANNGSNLIQISEWRLITYP